MKDLKLDPKVFSDPGFEAQYMRAVVSLVFQTYLEATTPHDFEAKFANMAPAP